MGVITFYANFSRRIGSLLEDDFTDAILLVEGVEIPVHRCILAAHCEYFRNLFSSKKRKIAYQKTAASGSQAVSELAGTSHSNHESKIDLSDVFLQLTDNVIELKNTKVEVVRSVLDYFYKGKYNFHENVETHLLALKLAHQINLKDLEETLIDHLVGSIALENFVQIYNIKMHYKNANLDNCCVSFLKEYGEEFAKSDSFSKLTSESLLSLLEEDNFSAPELDIFRAAERWAVVNKPNKKTVKDIVEKIRMATMSQKDLFDVSTSEEFPSIDIMEPIRSITQQDAASTNFRHQQRTPVDELNVAKSSLGAEVLSGDVTEADLISGSSGCTSHKVGGEPNCISIKLDQIYRLNTFKILLDSSKRRSYKYHVELSLDEKEWLRVVDHSNYWCRSHQLLRFDTRPVRFIRLTGTYKDLNVISLEATYSNKSCSLLQGISVVSTNVALASRGATITGHYIDENDPLKCFAGREKFCNCVFENYPLTITLGQPYWLSSLRLRIKAQCNNYTIESSHDGESWQKVCDEKDTDYSKVWRTFEFSRRVVLHFRVTNNRRNPDNEGIHLYEFESPASTIAVTN